MTDANSSVRREAGQEIRKLLPQIPARTGTVEASDRFLGLEFNKTEINRFERQAVAEADRMAQEEQLSLSIACREFSRSEPS